MASKQRPKPRPENRSPGSPPPTARSGDSPARVNWRLAVAVAALAPAGVGLYLWVEGYGSQRWADNDFVRGVLLIVLLFMAGLTAVIVGGVSWADRRYPAFRRRRLRALEIVRRPSRPVRLAIAVAVALGSASYFAYTAARQGRAFGLRIHDENMYVVQAQQIGHGRLWMPQHPRPDFFESFHVFARPVYAAMYFPGTALLYAPIVCAGLPTWPLSLALAGLGVALVYWLLTELIDGGAGLLGAFMMLGIGRYRYMSLMVMSHPLLMVLGVLMLLFALYWSRTRATRWLVLMGLCAGWMAITRPLDALCYAVPVAIIVLWEVRRDPWPARLRTLAIPVAAALPLLAIQLVMNYGIAGNLLKSPVTLYLQTYWPEMQVKPGGKPVVIPDLPTRHLPQFKGFYEEFVLPAVRAHQETPFGEIVRQRVETLASGSLPSSLLVVPAVIGLAGLMVDRRRWLVWVPLPLFALAYLMFPFFFPHYVTVVAPLGILACLAGVDALRRLAGARGGVVGTFAALAIVTLTVKALPEVNRIYTTDGEGNVVEAQGMVDQPEPMTTLEDVDAQLARLPKDERALVLFTYHPEVSQSWREEPVYTLDAPYPDLARVVRAHDLGDGRNRELFAHYAATQPDRRVYRYDMVSRKLTPMGVVKDLAAGR